MKTNQKKPVPTNDAKPSTSQKNVAPLVQNTSGAVMPEISKNQNSKESIRKGDSQFNK